MNNNDNKEEDNKINKENKGNQENNKINNNEDIKFVSNLKKNEKIENNDDDDDNGDERIIQTVKIDKNSLEFNNETKAEKYFDIRSRYEIKKKEIDNAIKEAKEKSFKFMVKDEESIKNKFKLERAERIRFDSESSQLETSYNQESETHNSQEMGIIPRFRFSKKSRAFDLDSSMIDLNKQYGIRDFNHFKLRKNYFNKLFMQKENTSAQKSHKFLEDLSKIVDNDPIYNIKPDHYLHLIKNSSLRGNFLINKPFFTQINTELDIGEIGRKLDQDRYEKLTEDELEYIEDFPNFPYQNELSTHYNYMYLLKGLIFDKKNLKNEQNEKIKETNNTDNTNNINNINSIINSETFQNLKLDKSFFENSKKSLLNKNNKNFPNLNNKRRKSINFVHGAIRYYDRPESHLEKKNFQQQVNLKDDNATRKLTLNDFNNHIENLILEKKKVIRNIKIKKRRDPKVIDNYKNYLEEAMDIILNMKPELLKTGIYQTFNHKLTLMVQNIEAYKGLYVGKHYILEIILFLLKEFLFCWYGVNNIEDEKDSNIDKNEKNEKEGNFFFNINLDSKKNMKKKQSDYAYKRDDKGQKFLSKNPNHTIDENQILARSISRVKNYYGKITQNRTSNKS